MKKLNNRMAATLGELINDFKGRNDDLYNLPHQVTKYEARIKQLKKSTDEVYHNLGNIIEISKDCEFDADFDVKIDDYDSFYDMKNNVQYYTQTLQDNIEAFLIERTQKYRSVVSKYINLSPKSVADIVCAELNEHTRDMWEVVAYGSKEPYSYQLRNLNDSDSSFFIQNSPVWFTGVPLYEEKRETLNKNYLSVPLFNNVPEIYQYSMISCGVAGKPVAEQKVFRARLIQNNQLYQKIPALEDAVLTAMLDFKQYQRTNTQEVIHERQC